jgi:hypothetical protein
MGDESTDSESSDDPLLHDIAHVLDFLKKSLCSGCTRRGGDVCDMVFPAHLPSSIQLSQRPDPCSVQEAMVASDAAGWIDAMDQEIENRCTHNVFKLVNPSSSSVYTAVINSSVLASN